jgi:excisionase family DNA binding protein
MPDRRWMSPEAAADYLDVRVDALRRLVKAGKLPAPDYRLGPRSPRFDREALDKAMGAGLPSRDPDQALEAYLEKSAQRSRRAA